MYIKGSDDLSFNLLVDLIHEYTGLCYEDGREKIILDKLLPLVASRGLDSFLDYYYYLKYSSEAPSEWRRVETALAVNETYFWREYDQIQAVADFIIPELQKKNPGRPIRIWHAACATGEEAYSMAITLLERPRYEQGNIEIFATDFNSEALSLARAGVYRSRSFRKIPAEILNKYFRPVEEGRYHLDEVVRRQVQFSHLNLMDDVGMAAMREMDIIFCRNVFIYFSQSSIRKTVENFHRSLRDPGYLLIAAVESLLKVTDLFELAEIGRAFVYEKSRDVR
jgi:chemotaxis protein methyltransferase CheR